MTVGEMLARMDSSELSEWIAFDRVEGIPDPHYGPALVASATYNAHGGKTKVSDFYPCPVIRPKQSTGEIKARLDAAVALGKSRAPAERV